MSLSKHLFSFQHIQNDQLILPILFKIVKMTTMIVNKQALKRFLLDYLYINEIVKLIQQNYKYSFQHRRIQINYKKRKRKNKSKADANTDIHILFI